MPCLDVLKISVGIDVGSSILLDLLGVLAAQTAAVQHQIGFHQASVKNGHNNAKLRGLKNAVYLLDCAI